MLKLRMSTIAFLEIKKYSSLLGKILIMVIKAFWLILDLELHIVLTGFSNFDHRFIFSTTVLVTEPCRFSVISIKIFTFIN